MKTKFILYGLSFTLLAIALSSYSHGRAAAGFASCGAPGDGNFTCINCHGSGNFAPTVKITFFDSTGTVAATKYVPSVVYTVRFTITSTNGTPAAYGFQMVSINKADSLDSKGFLPQAQQPDSFVHIVPLASTKRTYAEHPKPNPSNIFDVKWKAPAAKTGPVLFYAAGNAVNLNGGQTGDGAALTNTEFAEATTGVGELSLALRSINVGPNPSAGSAEIKIEATEDARLTLYIRDLSGRTIFYDPWPIKKGENKKELNLNGLNNGLYIISVYNGAETISKKLLKL